MSVYSEGSQLDKTDRDANVGQKVIEATKNGGEKERERRGKRGKQRCAM